MFGGHATMLSDYEEFIADLCSLLWDIDSHYYKLKSWYCSFPNVVEQKFLNFNKPQSHGHKPKQLSVQTISLQIDKLWLHLDRGYRNGTHMTLLRNIVKGICDSLDKYLDYLKKQVTLTYQKTIKQQFYLNLKQKTFRSLNSNIICMTIQHGKIVF